MLHILLHMQDDKLTIQTLLQDIGFSGAEAETYWVLINLETVSVRKVAAQSGVNRGSTYDAIRRLVAAGLVTARRKGEREYFAAENPEKIYDLIRDKRKDLWQVQQQAQKLIPEVMARKARPKGRPLVKYYEDDEGVVVILRDVLQTCSHMQNPGYCVYSTRSMRQYIYRKFPHFTARRVREGIMVRVIAIGDGGEPAGHSERKWLPEPAGADVSSYTIIYGDKVAQISISNDFTPYGVVVEDAGSAAMQRLLFEQLWQTL